jgi:ribonuclease P/MRP protein subunit RPP1
MITDTCVHPYPEGDTTLRRMALEARALGFDSIVAPSSAGSIYQGVRIIPFVLINEPDVRRISNCIKKQGREGVLMMVNAGENGFNRGVLKLKGLHILRSLHKTQKNSFDHITARIAADSHVAIDIDLYPLVHSSGIPRQKVLQRYRDIIILWSRYQFLLTISSNALSWLDLRSVDETALLCGLFGMGEEDVYKALTNVDTLLNPYRPVREVA